MEKPNIIYFYLDKSCNAKKHMWSRITMPLLEVDMEQDGRLICCQVPEFYMGDRGWKPEKLMEQLNAVLKGREYKSCYLQPELGKLLEAEEMLPPEILLHKLLKKVPCLEYVFYVGEGKETGLYEEEQLLFRLFEPYLSRINHFTLIADTPEGYGDFLEYVYEEYGIPTACSKRPEKRFGRDGKTVVLDGRRDYRVPYTMLPGDSFYVDLWSVEEKRGSLEKMRKDIRYMSTVKFLDTLVKNGYNTIVNQTHL